MAKDAAIGERFNYGFGVVVDPGVTIGDDVTLGNHVTICTGATLGDGVSVSDFAVVGKRPKLSARSTAKAGELPGVVVGAGSSIGSHTVLMAGSELGERCIVGDNAGVRERCRIGDDVVVGRSVTVENDTTIGSRTKIQSGAYITAYVTIEDDVFIAPMVVTTNDNFMGRTEKRFESLRGCTIRRGARVGGGSHILPGIEIGEEAFVATGSVVTRDVPPRMLVMGVPAKPVREVAAEELLENQ
ncbi:MAG: UDP-3-O-(3-hydroxymyristoyl)glucosamine N-acyltransferase [Coriobacteriaceae bacterium]|nr:UDP-3-O-(3-hydroxymyristoyl)glucosamine N-acyltransferase [Coriobacteriaceae bacterium]